MKKLFFAHVGTWTFVLTALWCGAAPPDSGKPDAPVHYTIATISGGVMAFTNAPNSTPVRLSFAYWRDDPSFGHVAVFDLTNGEPRSILVHNYRVQVRVGSATNSPVWETVADDYPGVRQISHLDAGASDKFFVTPPDRKPWRACLIYSRELKSGEGHREYGGTYELISREFGK